jgi:adenine-specific DNA methylase
VALIVTSPPYVTSYEYADLHQLTAIWLGYTEELSEFRTKFIGSIKKKEVTKVRLYSDLGKTIVENLRLIDKREADAIEHYFFDMQQSFEEMYRILTLGGRICIVIGDTDINKVKIHNADVFVQTLNEKTGRFVGTMKSDRLAYPFEYILIMEKA